MNSSRAEREEDLHAELGYRTAGQREVRQREWFSLRGKPGEPIATPREFAKVVNRLRVLKWQKANPQKKRANGLKYSRKPEKRSRQLTLSAKRYQERRREERQRADAVVFTCRECEVMFCKAPWTKGPSPNFCQNACYQRNKYHRDHPEARRNKPTKRVYVRGSRRSA